MKNWYTYYRNILYLHFSEQYYRLPESAKNAVSPTDPLKRVFRIVGYTGKRLIGNLFKAAEQPENLHDKVWLYVVSQNNYDSLKFIAEGLDNAVFVAGQGKNIGKYNTTVNRLSLHKKVLYYYKFFPLLRAFFKQDKVSTARFYDLLYDAVGFYEVYLEKLKKYTPKAIVFANDHNADARAMLLAANDLGIRTIYVQHATVSTLFPPLQFGLNLLEGQDALEKYKACGPISGRVQLIGMPKADAYVPSRNKNKTITAVGIAVNIMDSVEEAGQLLKALTRHFPALKITLRPHPRDTRDFSFVKKISPLISFSDSRTEPVFEFLKKQDAIISGNSSIHLEAVLLNIWAIYMNLNRQDNLQDYYGYIEHGLVDYAADLEQLLQLLSHHLSAKPDVVHRARYYNATVGTAYDGKSTVLAMKHITAYTAH